MACKTFGGTPEEARPHALRAPNQDFCNLLLTPQVLTGIALAVSGHVKFGTVLILAGTGVILAAAVILTLASTPHCGMAIKQGILPLLAVFCTVVALLSWAGMRRRGDEPMVSCPSDPERLAMQYGSGTHCCGAEKERVVDTPDVSIVSTQVLAFNPTPIALGKAATWQIGRWWLAW